MGQATMRDVAAAAGVSPATVSRVLNGSKPVSAALRHTVMEACERLAYTPDPIASALRGRQTGTIGMIVPEIANPFVMDLVSHVEAQARTRGVQLLLCNSSQEPAKERELVQVLLGRHVDGLVLNPVDAVHSATAVQMARDSEAPLVQIDQSVHSPFATWVGVDDQAAMRMVLSHLRDRGAHRVGYIGSRLMDSSSIARFSAAQTYAELLGMRLEPALALHGTYSASWGREAATRISGHRERPDAIVCSADIIAFGAVQALREQGIDVPGDMLVTGFDDIELSRINSPTITTVKQPLEEMASRAIDLLLSPEAGPQRVLLAPDLIVRQTSTRSEGEA